jgi:hypothetical protein
MSANLAVAMALVSRGRIAGAMAFGQGPAVAIALRQLLQSWPRLIRIVAAPGAITMQMG